MAIRHRPGRYMLLYPALGLAFACSDPASTSSPTTLVTITEINDVALCPTGGSVISVGRDANDNGTLDANEVDSSYPVCDGRAGSTAAVATSPLALGDANCPGGGVQVDTGLDENGNGMLDGAEIASTSYLCNGVAPETRVDINPSGAWVLGDESTICPGNGTEVVSYIDLDSNGTYTAGTDTLLASDGVCFGDDTLVVTTTLPIGDAQCPQGGTRIDSGRDANGNGVLDMAEIADTSYACAVASRVTSNSSGGWMVLDEAASCTDGGTEILSFVDLDGDNTYSVGDLLIEADFACNGSSGVDGLDSLSNATYFSGNQNGCPSGGNQIDFGLDLNGDGSLQPGEVTSTYFVCDGTAGLNEGSTATPIAIAASPTPQLATVGAGGSSYYQLTTLDAGGRMAPYTLGFYASESVLDIDVYSDGFVTPINVACTVDPFSGTQQCATDRLASTSTMSISATEQYLVSNQYFFNVGFGAVEGTEAAPIDAGALAGGNLTISAANYPNGFSYYSFSTASAGVHTLSLENFLADPSQPPSTSESVFVAVGDSPSNVLAYCSFDPSASTTCLLNIPTPGVYMIAVAYGHAGAIFDIDITEGGASLPELQVSDYATQLATPIVEPLPTAADAWYRVSTQANAELTILIETTGAEPGVWELSDSSLTPVYYCYTGMCSTNGLAPNTEYFLRVIGPFDAPSTMSAYNQSFGVNETLAFSGNYSAYTTTGNYGHESQFHLNTGAFGSIDISVSNVNWPSWSQQSMYVEIYEFGMPFGGCIFDMANPTCTHFTAPGNDISLVFVDSGDLAFKFDLTLTGN